MAEEDNKPAAGWYKDPSDPQQKRYWDGVHWTKEVKAIAASKAPEGWYADPKDSRQQRYWNGQKWTARLRPTALAQPTALRDTTSEKAGDGAGASRVTPAS